jgi:hypothetical protein
MFELVVLVIVMAFIGLAIALYWRDQSEQERSRLQPAADKLLGIIRANQIDKLNLNAVATEFDLSEKQAKLVAERVYRRCFSTAIDIPEIRSDLDKIQSRLYLATNDRQQLEHGVLSDRYAQAWMSVSKSGFISVHELDKLCRMQSDLSISQSLVRRAVGQKGAQVYLDAYRSFLQQLPQFDQAYLQRVATASGLSFSDTYRIAKPDAIAFFRRRVELTRNKSGLNSSDLDEASQLLSRLQLDQSDVLAEWTKLEKAVHLQSVRGGNIPVIQVRIAHRAGEKFHYHARCTFGWLNPRGDFRTDVGELYISNHRVLFASNAAGSNFEVKLSSIIDVESTLNGIAIRATSSRGTGTYTVADCENLEAILVGLLGTAFTLDDQELSYVRNRIIPSSVKRHVWNRDNGRCVLCGSSEDIHFDHDIPFSRGGSSTVENIRLLCARCNLSKSAKIE